MIKCPNLKCGATYNEMVWECGVCGRKFKKIERNILLLDGIDFYTDQTGEAYAFIKETKENLQINSKKFRAYIIKKLKLVNELPLKNDIDLLIQYAESEAQDKDDSLDLCRRYEYNLNTNSLIVDVCNRKWEFVEINPSKVEKINSERPIFKRTSGMKELKIEVGNKEAYDKYLDLMPIKEESRLIIEVYIIALTLSCISRPHLMITGHHGSAKTTSAKLIKKLLDPTSPEIMSLPSDLNELSIQLEKQYLPLYDNISNLSQSQTDVLCRAITGDGNLRRKLYTDNEEITFEYIRSVIFTGINLPSQAPDFLDRLLIIELERIEPNNRKTIKEIDSICYSLLPYARGYIFETLSKAFEKIDEVTNDLKELPRMADFTIYGEAIARALGYEPLEFYNKYMVSIGKVSEKALDESILAESLIDLAKENWEGSITELHQKLRDISQTIPKSPNYLSQKIKQIEPNLKDVGIIVYRSKDSKSRRSMIKLSEGKSAFAPFYPSLTSEQNNERTKDMKDTKDNLVKVIIKKDIPCFLNPNGKGTFGPFKKNEEVEIDYEIANILKKIK